MQDTDHRDAGFREIEEEEKDEDIANGEAELEKEYDKLSPRDKLSMESVLQKFKGIDLSIVAKQMEDPEKKLSPHE